MSRGIIEPAQLNTIKGAQGPSDLLNTLLQQPGVAPQPTVSHICPSIFEFVAESYKKSSVVPHVIENTTWSLEKLRTFGSAIDTLAQANFISCLFWGGLKAALMVCILSFGVLASDLTSGRFNLGG